MFPKQTKPLKEGGIKGEVMEDKGKTLADLRKQASKLQKGREWIIHNFHDRGYTQIFLSHDENGKVEVKIWGWLGKRTVSSS